MEWKSFEITCNTDGIQEALASLSAGCPVAVEAECTHLHKSAGKCVCKHMSTFLWNALSTELSLGCTQPGPWNQRAALSTVEVDIGRYTYSGALLFIEYCIFQCSKFKDMYLYTKFHINEHNGINLE